MKNQRSGWFKVYYRELEDVRDRRHFPNNPRRRSLTEEEEKWTEELRRKMDSC